MYSRLALAGSVFYLIHHIIVKTNLFLISGVVQRLRGYAKNYLTTVEEYVAEYDKYIVQNHFGKEGRNNFV